MFLHLIWARIITLRRLWEITDDTVIPIEYPLNDNASRGTKLHVKKV